MPALNSHVNRRGGNNDNGGGISQAVMNNLNFTNLFAIVFGILNLKERWENHQDSRKEAELRRNLLSQGIDPQSLNDGNSSIRYRDNPSSENINLSQDIVNEPSQSAPMHLDPEDLRPIRHKRHNCCVCCGIRCDLVFKALGVVFAFYFCYGVFRVYKWATTPSPTGLEDMPEYGTSLGCTSAPFVYPKDTFFSQVTDETNFNMDIVGGAVGTVFLTRGDSSGVVVKMLLTTDEEPLLEKSAVLMQEESTNVLFSLSTPLSSISEDACMRFDLIVQIPKELNTFSLKSQSIVHVKYDERAPLSLKNLTIDLTSKMKDNLILPDTEIGADEVSLTMRGGYLVGSLSFRTEARVWTKYGDTITNLHVNPLPISKHLNYPSRLITSGGSGRTDIVYSNSEGRVISSSHSSAQGDLYLTYRDTEYNGPITVQAKSTTSTNVQREMRGAPGSKPEMWVGDKEGDDRLDVKSSGWVGLYF